MKLNKPILVLILTFISNFGISQVTVDSTLNSIYDLRYSNSDSALKILMEVEAREHSSWEQGEINDYRGDIYWYKGEYEKSMEYYSLNLDLYGNLKDTNNMGLTYADIGYIYMDMKKYTKALELYQLAFDIAIKYKNDKLIYLTSTYKGQLNQMLGNHEKAIAAYQEAIDSDLKQNNERNIAILYNNMGSVYVSMKQFNKAIECADKAYPTWEKLEDKNGLANYNTTVGTAYVMIENYEKAEKYLLTAEKLNLELGKTMYLTEVYFGLIEIFMFKKNKGQMKFYIDKIEVITKVSPNPNLMESYYSMLAEYYAFSNQNDSAYFYLSKYLNLKDSTMDISKQEQITLLSEQFDTEKKEYDIKLLKSENEKDKIIIHQQDRQLYFMIAALSLFLVLSIIIFINYKERKKAFEVVSIQKDEIQKKNNEINDSIKYAKRIQNAILPASKIVKEYLKDSFILYKPKDVVAGDFYWMESVGNDILFAAADCTGHGVPGAMVSVVCHNAMNRSVREFGLTEPGLILDKTREIVLEEFSKSEDDVKDGMDIALCSLNFEMGKCNLKYAGANNPLWIIRNNDLIETKADRQPIGKFENVKPYTTHNVELFKGDSVYIFTDGYADQFGGQNDKKFSIKRLKRLLLSINDKSTMQQQDILQSTFEDWMKQSNAEQIDDVCGIGLKIC